MKTLTDAQCTELVNAALNVALCPSTAAYRSPWRGMKQVNRDRLARLLRVLGELDLNERNAGDVLMRLQALRRCEADEGQRS